MAIIDTTSPVLKESSSQFWQDELHNAKVLLHEVDKALHTLIVGGHQSYELDTGQSRQRVTRQDLGKLETWRSSLLADIKRLEAMCGEGEPAVKIVRPGW